MPYHLRIISLIASTIKKIDLTNEQAESILDSDKYLKKVSRIFVYYYMVSRNLEEFISYYESYLYVDESERIDSAECNRLLLNFLDSLYTYCNAFNKMDICECKAVIDSAKKESFDLRLFLALRGRTVHSELGITNISTTIGKVGTKTTSYIKLNKLANYITNKKDSFKRELETISPELQSMDLLQLAKTFHNTLVYIQVNIWLRLSEKILASFNAISKYADKDNLQNTEIGLYNGAKYISPISITIKSFYTAFARKFVYQEKLLTHSYDNPINEFFSKLSFLFYGEKDTFLPQ